MESHGGETAGKDGQLRIYIGGLGGGITADDLKKTFSTPQLGAVESVEIIRTKGRSIAYLDFRPCSEKGLAKLFSTYNGCLWKGGKLKLEKAKEHYMIRMKREWEEDAQLSSISDECVDSVESSVPPPEKLVKDRLSDIEPLKIFIPKLRKVKPIPFKGSGKHKYSFQRVPVPSLPVHFCDCDEHSVPWDTAKGPHNHENAVYEIKEEEFDMMNSVMSKLFDRKKVPQPASSKPKVAVEAPISTNSNDEFQADDKEDEMADEDDLTINDKADEMSDDEDLLINVVGQSNDSLINKHQESQQSQSRPLQRKREIQGKKPFQQIPEYAPSPVEVEMSDDDDLLINVVGRPNDNLITKNQELHHPRARPLQRKQEIRGKKPFQQMPEYATDAPSPVEVEMSDDDNLVFNVVSGSNNKIPSVDSWVQKTIVGDKDLQASQSERAKGKRKIQVKDAVQPKKKSKVAFGEDKYSAPKTKQDSHETSDDEEPPTQAAEQDSGVQHAKGFSWKDLVSGRDSGCFSISDVLPSEPPMVEKQPKSETPVVFEKESQRNDSSEAEPVKKTSEVLPQKSKAETSKAGESTSSAQKFSWKHLVGGVDDGSFSLSQIAPASKNLEKLEQHVKTLAEPIPDSPGLILSNSVQVSDIAKSGEAASSSELHGKQAIPAKQSTIKADEAGDEAFTFKKSNASIKEWKMAKAALSRSRNKNTAKD